MRSEGYRLTVVGRAIHSLSVCPSVCPSVTTFSPATRNKTAKKRYQRVQCHTGFILKNGFFGKNAAFESYVCLSVCLSVCLRKV